MKSFDQKNLTKINYVLAVLVGLLGIVALSMLVYPREQSQHESSEHVSLQPQNSGIQNSWEIQCLEYESNRNDNEACFSRYLTHDDRGARVEARLFMVQREGVLTPRLQITAPLGIFLPTGMTLSLPQQEEFAVPIQFCEKHGCYINLDLADDVVHALSNSNALRVSYKRSNYGAAEALIKLNNFTDALTHLKQREE